MLNNFYNNLIHKNILIISNIYFLIIKKNFQIFVLSKKNIKMNLIINNNKQKKFNY